MTINDIFNFLQEKQLVKNHFNVTSDFIYGITDDSRKVTKDFVFIAVKGATVDGNEFINDAVSKGAKLIISEQERPKTLRKNNCYIQVSNARVSISLLSSFWFGNPSEKLKIIGVTGTKGKTTVVHLIYHILKDLGFKVGMISTIKAVIGDKTFDTGLHVTNPEPLILQSLLKKMVDNGLEYVVLEVTSHGLDQERVYGINFDIGVLTNITKEHLDYHKSFVKYREAKFRLFENSKKIVLNKDDLSYEIFTKKIKNKEIIAYSQKDKADIYGYPTKIEKDEMFYKIICKGKSYEGVSKLLGSYNYYNILAAISAVGILGVDIPNAILSLDKFTPPEGRLEKVINKKGIEMYIDFAHTPDSLENLLSLLRNKKEKKLICIFGCAGERDKSKRFKMGEISGRLSDISVITAEDPRSEDVLVICDQIKRGILKSKAVDYFKNLKHRHSYLIIPDRAEAIYYSIEKIAKKGDTVVVCGKGHEKSMCYGNIEHPWSDLQTIKEVFSTKFDKTAILMGAGRGKRLNSLIPKVVHKIAEKPMLSYTINGLRRSGFKDLIVVVGYNSKMVIKEIGPSVDYVFQKKPLGTGHAASIGLENTDSKCKEILVVNGDDSAFYTSKTFSEIYNSHIKNGADMTFTSAVLDDPLGMGRVIRKESGELIKIVEDKNANIKERKIKEVNLGMYVFDRRWFLNNIGKIKKEHVGEYYITNLIAIAIDQKDKINIYRLKDINEWHGVNTIEQLKSADKKMKEKIQKEEFYEFK